MEYNKRIVSFGTYLKHYFKSAFSTADKVLANKETITREFDERIMLAVTEVNGCKVCSQAHAKIALDSGISNEEISKLLSGNNNDIPSYQARAIAFATYYADVEGKISKEEFNKIKIEYGIKDAYTILADIRIILIGNSLGIAGNTFSNRLHHNHTDSSLIRELLMFISTALFIPIYLVIAIIGFAVRPFKK